MLNSTHSSSRSAKKTRNEKKTPSARLTEAPVQSQDAKTAKTPRDWSGDRAEHDALDAGGKPGDTEYRVIPTRYIGLARTHSHRTRGRKAVDFDRGIDDRASQSVDFFVRLFSWRLDVLAISRRKTRVPT